MGLFFYRPPIETIFSDSFEFSNNWEGTYNISTAISGSSNFTISSFQDNFEFPDNWNGTYNISTAISGSSNFTISSFQDSFETGDGWT